MDEVTLVIRVLYNSWYNIQSTLGYIWAETAIGMQDHYYNRQCAVSKIKGIMSYEEHSPVLQEYVMTWRSCLYSASEYQFEFDLPISLCLMTVFNCVTPHVYCVRAQNLGHCICAGAQIYLRRSTVVCQRTGYLGIRTGGNVIPVPTGDVPRGCVVQKPQEGWS